jgi:hypothetical protein
MLLLSNVFISLLHRARFWRIVCNNCAITCSPLARVVRCLQACFVNYWNDTSVHAIRARGPRAQLHSVFTEWMSLAVTPFIRLLVSFWCVCLSISFNHQLYVLLSCKRPCFATAPAGLFDDKEIHARISLFVEMFLTTDTFASHLSVIRC